MYRVEEFCDRALVAAYRIMIIACCVTHLYVPDFYEHNVVEKFIIKVCQPVGVLKNPHQ